MLKKEPLVIFDGGHNENAIKNLKENISQYFGEYNKKVYIISLLKTKDFKKIVKLLLEENNNSYFYFTDGNDKTKYVSKEDLYNEAIKYSLNKDNLFKKDLLESIKEAMKKYDEELILIIGSFYIYKDIKKIF